MLHNGSPRNTQTGHGDRFVSESLEDETGDHRAQNGTPIVSGLISDQPDKTNQVDENTLEVNLSRNPDLDHFRRRASVRS